jgi:hypothetical protein
MSDHVMRVQIPAYTDHWMRGDRFGNVVKVVRARPKGGRALLLTSARNSLWLGDIEIAHVLLDKSNKIARVVLADCEVVS